MKPIIAFACVWLVAGSALADPYSAAMQQARRVANQETEANRRLMNNPPPATPQSNPAQPVNPELQATMQNIQNLRTDLATLAKLTNSVSIAAERKVLTNDLAKAAYTAQPKPKSLAKLADDLTTVAAGNEKLLPQDLKLAQYVHAIANSSQLTEAQRQMIFTQTRQMLAVGDVAPEAATNVVNDIKAISSETRQE